ncbi:MAG TPA: YfhO family protein, partial [Thermoanaerobaculia bacterium]
ATPGHLVLAAPKAHGETLVATSIPLSAGWRATGEGRTLQAVTVDGACLGVRVPAGVERIELSFVPRGFVAGCVLCGVGLLGCLALLVAPSLPGKEAG